jgi:hypothetical protein
MINNKSMKPYKNQEKEGENTYLGLAAVEPPEVLNPLKGSIVLCPSITLPPRLAMNEQKSLN